jgi:outer membrane protein
MRKENSTSFSKNSVLLPLILVFTVLNFGGVGFLLFSHFTNEKKIVFINATKLFTEYNGTKQARQGIESTSLEYQAHLDTLKAEVNKLISVYERDQTKSTNKEKSFMQQLIETKRVQVENYQAMVHEQMSKKESESMTQLLAEINSKIKEYADKNNYDFVLASTQQGNIAYGKDYLDITDELIKILNK